MLPRLDITGDLSLVFRRDELYKAFTLYGRRLFNPGKTIKFCIPVYHAAFTGNQYLLSERIQ